MSIRIVTDSSSDLASDLAPRWDITVLPCYVIIDGVTYRDGLDISHDDFYQQLSSNAQIPTTSQPSVADFLAVYRELLSQGHQVISIHVSGKLSGTINSAEQARASLGDEAAESIEIVDSQLASICLGLVVVGAAQQTLDSESHHQLAEKIRRDLPLTRGYFVLDTLEYLQKGGRIGKAQAYLGSVLNVKPILTLRDGEVHPVERPRNRERALRRVAELARELAPFGQLAVVHSTEPERANELREMLSELLPEGDVIMSRFGPTLGTYIGPKAVGVAVTQTATTS